MMKFALVLAGLVACVSAHDVKGIKSPPGNRNYFMSPSRRAVAHPVNDGKTVKQIPYDDVNYGKTQEAAKSYEPVKPYQEPVKGYEPAKPYQEPVKGYEPAKPYQEPVKGYEPAKPYQEPVKGYEPAKPYQEPVKGYEPVKAYEPQRPVFQKPVEQQAKGQRSEFAPVPQAPQAPQSSDDDDQSDGFDTPTQPAFNFDPAVDESPVPQSPVPQSPVPQEPVPQSSILKSPSARKPYYKPQLPQSPQEPQQQQAYHPQVPQEPQQHPQQRYDVPLTYGRRPATTLLRTPTGFQLSPGLAAYPIV